MNFPKTVPFWGNDFIESTMLLNVKKKDSGDTEDVFLTSVMELRRGNPYKTKSGYSKIDISIKKWTANGFCKLVGKNIEYRLSAGRAQPVSIVEAMQPESDYPARMTFNAMFDVYIDNKQVLEGLSGTAQATEMMTIPPRGDDIFTVNKPFEIEGFEMEAVRCERSQSQLTRRQSLILRIGSMLRIVPQSTIDNLT